MHIIPNETFKKYQLSKAASLLLVPLMLAALVPPQNVAHFLLMPFAPCKTKCYTKDVAKVSNISVI